MNAVRPTYSGLSLRWQVASASVVIVLLVSAFFGLYYPGHATRLAKEAKAQSVSGAAAMVALSVGVGLQLDEPSAVAAAFQWARRDSSLRYVAVYDTSGNRVAAYDPDTLRLDEAFERRQFEIHEWQNHFVIAAPVRFQDQHLGTIVLASSLGPIHASAAADRRAGLIASLALMLVGVTLSLWTAARIATPIVNLRHAAESIAAGNYEVNLAPSMQREVGALTTAFGAMAATIQRQISDLAAQARELVDARDAALSAAEAKSAFLATMSHEIRTPMNGVLGMLELVSDTPLDDEQKSFVQVASSSAESLLQIINDILDFSKLEAGRFVIEQVPFDLRQVIEDTLRTFRVQARAKGIRQEFEYPNDVPTAFIGDPGRIRQVVTNLVGNALKFTARGDVALTVSLVKLDDSGAEMCVEISDTGVGMSPDVVERLFQPFSQADSSTTRRYGGTGLGLAICKQLVTLMGGTIGVRSKEHVGSQFWFTVRLDVSEQPNVYAEPLRDGGTLTEVGVQ